MVFAIFTFFAFVFRKKNRKIRKVRKVKNRKVEKQEKCKKYKKQKSRKAILFDFSTFRVFRVFRLFAHGATFRFFDFSRKNRFGSFPLFYFSTFRVFPVFRPFAHAAHRAAFHFFEKVRCTSFSAVFHFLRTRPLFIFSHFRTIIWTSGFPLFPIQDEFGFVVLVLCTLTTYFFLLLQRGKTILQVTLTWWFGLVVWKSGKSVFSKYFILK